MGAAIRSTADSLKKLAGPLALAQVPFRYLVAAGLVLTGEDAGAFADQVAGMRRLCRDCGLPHRGHQVTLAGLILSLLGSRIDSWENALGRIRLVFQEVKRSHPWIGGAWDLPIGALHAGHRETATHQGRAIEDAYRSLRQRDFKGGGRAILTAAGLLPLAGRSTDVTVMRFRDLARGFRNRRVSVWASDYADLAVLALLDTPPDVLVHRVLEYRRRLSRLRSPAGRIVGFHLAVGLVAQERIGRTRTWSPGPPANVVRAALFVPLAALATAGR